MELDIDDVKGKWIKSWKAMLGYQIVLGILSLPLRSYVRAVGCVVAVSLSQMLL